MKGTLLIQDPALLPIERSMVERREGKCEGGGRKWKRKAFAFLLYFGQWTLSLCFNVLVKKLILVHYITPGLFSALPGQETLLWNSSLWSLGGMLFMGNAGKDHGKEKVLIP